MVNHPPQVKISLFSPPEGDYTTTGPFELAIENNLFNVYALFSYFEGYGGKGKSCGKLTVNVFHQVTDSEALVQCKDDDVDTLHCLILCSQNGAQDVKWSMNLKLEDVKKQGSALEIALDQVSSLLMFIEANGNTDGLYETVP
ncbi:uncharacterized protein BT62DRAFT_921987 [Guyanagaster necrorhizus]|uniref:Uncharacterized protein n=1 Tax=Guyanagaster necrorhizus TaxID=856835 RepID=A0A9P8AR56_9AGAR|nr:uncharacterized protein BT62DRAFT_921987 [Guyanagaster necrorhizus MCA 3950]KAG7443527.1 hypothetical protein BT62DRAFT_921987 [Guyanagaster necrorhizus MCA 3950]